MPTRRLIPLVLILVLPFVYSCGDDDSVNGIVDPPDPDPYRSLTVRDNVLFNLEKCWNERNIERFDELLDSNFVFVFSAADVKNGDVLAADWDRAAEMSAAANMFDPNYVSSIRDPVSSINLTLTYGEGENFWAPFLPDEEEFPGETWFSKSFRYRLTVETGDYTYVGDNILASVTLRQAPGGGGDWRIVSWRDDNNNALNETARGGSSTQDTTWGKVKSLYAD
jgi:hypothetical protein